MRIKFTAGRIAGFTCPADKKQAFLWDTDTKGLGLKASPGGAKKYVLESRLSTGDTIRLTIGDPKTWTIDAAQAEARRLQTQIDQGIDPREQKAAQIKQAEAAKKEAKRQTATVGEAWKDYVEARTPKWSQRHLADHRKIMQTAQPKGEGKQAKPRTAGPLAALADLKLSELTQDRISEWLKSETTTRPTQTALAFRLLRAFLNWCADRSEFKAMADSDACSRKVSREHLPKKKAKTDCLQREQLRPWFEQIQRISTPVVSVYLQALLLTGARREELAGLQWSNVDFRWKSLTIRDKVDGERTIPLTPYVAHLLRELKRLNDTPPSVRQLKRWAEQDKPTSQPSPWVFSSPAAKSGRLQDPSIAHRKAVEAAGLPTLTLHGLRRSFGTLAEWVECPAGVSAQIMGHKPSATAEKHYRVRPLDLLRMWHQKIEAWILEQASVRYPEVHINAAGAMVVDSQIPRSATR